LLLVAVLVGCAGNQQQARPAVDTVAITASLDSLNKVLVAAVAARDTDAVVALYAPDARLLPAGMPRADGHDAIRTVWVGMLKTPGLELNLSDSQPMITEAGDMIIDIGSYSMKMKDAKGKPAEEVGKYVTIFKKVDGTWKIVVDTFNTDKAPAGM
jgi:uncharacterized protein (TIGR02246 family)